MLSFPGGSDGKDSTCNAGDLSSIPGLGRSPGGGHGNPLQCSCLENPMDRGAWQAPQRVRHDWVTEHSTTQLIYYIWSVFLHIAKEFSKVILLISHPIAVFESPSGFRLYLNSWGYFHFLFFIQYECTFVKHSPSYLCKNSISMGYSFFFHRAYNQDTLISVMNWFSKSSTLLLFCNKFSECISDLNLTRFFRFSLCVPLT